MLFNALLGDVRSAAGVGDFNGDDIDDLLLSVAVPGECYLVFGSSAQFPAQFELASLNGDNGFTISGENGSDLAGRSVAAGGDLTGDGFADVLIGASGAAPNGRNGAGQTYVLFGTDSPIQTPLELSSLQGATGFRIEGACSGDNSGYGVSSGDFNGDGNRDMIISAHLADGEGASDVGNTFVVWGRATALACRAGGVNGSVGQPADVLLVNGSHGEGISRDVDVETGERLWAAMLPSPAGGSGRFVVHANIGTPDVNTTTVLPFDVGVACFDFILPGANPNGIWNGLGKRNVLGASTYLDGTAIPDPEPSPTFFLHLSSGDPDNLPPGTTVTFQGLIVDPGSSSPKGVSATNAIILTVLP